MMNGNFNGLNEARRLAKEQKEKCRIPKPAVIDTRMYKVTVFGKTLYKVKDVKL